MHHVSVARKRLKPAECFERGERAWQALTPRLQRLRAQDPLRVEELKGEIMAALSPWGLAAPVEEISGGIARVQGEPRPTLDQLIRCGGAEAEAARLLRQDLKSRFMKGAIGKGLQEGMLSTADPESLQRFAKNIVEDCERAAGDRRLGRGLVSAVRGNGGFGPELKAIVWPLYCTLVPLFLDTRGRRRQDAYEERTATNPTGKSRAQYYPKQLLDTMADLISGRWGGVLGEVTPQHVKSQVQALFKQDAGLADEIDRLWLQSLAPPPE